LHGIVKIPDHEFDRRLHHVLAAKLRRRLLAIWASPDVSSDCAKTWRAKCCQDQGRLPVYTKDGDQRELRSGQTLHEISFGSFITAVCTLFSADIIVVCVFGFPFPAPIRHTWLPPKPARYENDTHDKRPLHAPRNMIRIAGSSRKRFR